MPAKECSIDSLGDKLSARLFLPDHILSPVPCILLVHGAIDKKSIFLSSPITFCKMGFAALALDMHGHGGSEGERFHVRMDQWVPDLEAAIAYLRAWRKWMRTESVSLAFLPEDSRVRVGR